MKEDIIPIVCPRCQRLHGCVALNIGLTCPNCDLNRHCAVVKGYHSPYKHYELLCKPCKIQTGG